ncbi:DNA mismatch repair endonuclease MutL [Clostridium rectalis]|uniref:DNA mismatch repair endonuclease MutL n=1 Tax=Clostridium rectalis TaxID=2040295 RepID=UPI000F638EFE|nr:DNA mismatch repair endonuclease MutL [Clostridium rectalis]
MSRINLLNKDTFNKIAAGEVVERPFSVVKELLENSIDANSKNIIVEIEEGGQKFIKITDDGDGIHPEDIEKAFLPHATSKISKIEDLFLLNTMGFRGEALASIASVSKVLLKSKIDGLQFGSEVYIEGGNIQQIKEIGLNTGTIIEVRDLFYNVPARLKFLKSSSREASLISDIVHRLSLAHSNISFRLINNGKVVLNTFGSNKLEDTIRTVYGKQIANNIINFEIYKDIISVYGYVGNAEIARGSRNNQSIFVNKRYIKNKSITVAVENAFKSFLTINKFPFFIVFIDIFPEYVDVNVHPTKTEIKFRDDRLIFSTVFNAVHGAIRNSLINSFSIEETSFNKENSKFNQLEKLKVEKVQFPIDLKCSSESYKKEENDYKKNILVNNTTCNEIKEDSIISYTNNSSVVKGENYYNIEGKLPKELNDGELKTKEPSIELQPKFPTLNIIGQFNNTYILSECLNELYIIDQHAAHEKVLFEKYMNDIKNQEVISQILLSPVIIELFPEDFIYYVENKEIFKNAGFTIEVFGDNTISIREVPFLMGKPEINNLLLDLIDNIKNMGSGKTSEIKYDSIAKIACKSAVKAHDKLSLNEMETLIKKLRYINDPFTCPHGRPTIIKITLNELEKRFKRIQ